MGRVKPAPLVGQRLPRQNDRRLLTAGGRYVDDIVLPGMVHAAIVRSSSAHGWLRGLNRSGLTVPVELVLAPDEIRDRTGPTPVLWHLPGQFQHERPVVDVRVRFVGEPGAIVVAASRSAARDAVDQLYLEIDELPAIIDPIAALAADAPLLYPDEGTNLMAAWDTGDTAEHLDSVMAACARRLTTTLRIGRLAGVPMECRGVIAAPDPTGKLTVWISTQAPHAVRDTIAQVCGLRQHQIRVIAADVGGGFGVKDHIYEDELTATSRSSPPTGREMSATTSRSASKATDACARCASMPCGPTARTSRSSAGVPCSRWEAPCQARTRGRRCARRLAWWPRRPRHWGPTGGSARLSRPSCASAWSTWWRPNSDSTRSRCGCAT